MTVDGDFVLEMMLYPYEWTLQEHRPRLLSTHFAIRAIRIVTPLFFDCYLQWSWPWVDIRGNKWNVCQKFEATWFNQNDECDRGMTTVIK